jgi:thiol-disulfide isomerase/thioredoxin
MKIIKIGSLGCPSCLIMNNVINNVLKEINVDIINLDLDLDEDEVKQYNVGKILPVLIFIDQNDNEITRLIGENSKETLIQTIQKYNSQ